MAPLSAVEVYIEQFDEPVQTLLANVREAVRSAAPYAEERIGYGMPAYFTGEALVSFTAMKSHIGFCPTAYGISAFAHRLGAYRFSKGAVRFPFSRPLPCGLIREMTACRVRIARAKRAK